MAKIGLKYPVYALLGEAGAYTGGANFAKAVKADVKIDNYSAKLHADDGLAGSDTSFKEGTLTFEVDDLGLSVSSILLGHEFDEETNIQVSKAGDTAPYVGFGFYGVRVKNNVKSYVALWLPKVKFGEPSDSFETKGDNADFKTSTIEGTISQNKDGEWREVGEFTTEAEAVTYLKGKAGIVTT